jgi:hypothetical protein
MTTKLDTFNPIFSSENSLNIIVGVVTTNNVLIGNLNQNSFATIADKTKGLNYYLEYPRLEEVPDNFKIVYNGFDKQYEFSFGDDVSLIKSAKFSSILSKTSDTPPTVTSTISTNTVSCKFGAGLVTKFQYIIYYAKNTGISTEYSNKGWTIEKDGTLKNNLKMGIMTDDIETQLNLDSTESHKAKVLTHGDVNSGYIEIKLGKTLSNNHVFVCDTSEQTSDLNIKLLPPDSDYAKYDGIEFYFVHYSLQNPSNSTFLLLTDSSSNLQETIGLGKNQALVNIRCIWSGTSGKWVTQK